MSTIDWLVDRRYSNLHYVFGGKFDQSLATEN